MRVVLVGPHWSGGQLMESIASGFRDASCEVAIFYDDKRNIYSYFRKVATFLGPSGFHTFFLEKFREAVTSRFLKFVDVYHPDFVIVVNGHNILPDIILEIRKRFGIKVVAWLVDDVSIWPDTPILSHLSAYNLVFVGDEGWANSLKFLRDSDTIFCVPQGGDPHIFKPLHLQKDIDVLLVGNFLPNRPLFGISYLRGGILDFLARNGFCVKIMGAGADSLPRYFSGITSENITGKSISDKELNVVLNRSKITLNIMAPQYHFDYSSRVFNNALAEAFQLVDIKQNLEHYFSSKEVIGFGDLHSLKDLVTVYLKNERARENLAKLSRQQALNKNTWAHRANAIIRIIYG